MGGWGGSCICCLHWTSEAGKRNFFSTKFKSQMPSIHLVMSLVSVISHLFLTQISISFHFKFQVSFHRSHVSLKLKTSKSCLVCVVLIWIRKNFGLCSSQSLIALWTCYRKWGGEEEGNLPFILSMNLLFLQPPTLPWPPDTCMQPEMRNWEGLQWPLLFSTSTRYQILHRAERTKEGIVQKSREKRAVNTKATEGWKRETQMR